MEFDEIILMVLKILDSVEQRFDPIVFFSSILLWRQRRTMEFHGKMHSSLTAGVEYFCKYFHFRVELIGYREGLESVSEKIENWNLFCRFFKRS